MIGDHREVMPKVYGFSIDVVLLSSAFKLVRTECRQQLRAPRAWSCRQGCGVYRAAPGMKGIGGHKPNRLYQRCFRQRGNQLCKTLLFNILILAKTRTIMVIGETALPRFTFSRSQRHLLDCTTAYVVHILSHRGSRAPSSSHSHPSPTLVYRRC